MASKVLILVLMEYTQRETIKVLRTKKLWLVLILVLMEYTQREQILEINDCQQIKVIKSMFRA